MEVVLRLEEQFGVNVDADAIARLVSIPEICAALREQDHV
jgi:acyl carrier protein